MEHWASATADLLGLDRAISELTFTNMACRAFVVFFAGVVLLRLGARRGLGRSAGFDILLGVILGSVLSRGINGESPFFPTLGAGLVLVLLHQFLSWATCHWHGLSVLAKGHPLQLVRDGRIDREALRRSRISEDDLKENIRLNGNVSTPEEVAEAHLERNGEVSVVRRGREPPVA